jgi:hypothetical protein
MARSSALVDQLVVTQGQIRGDPGLPHQSLIGSISVRYSALRVIYESIHSSHSFIKVPGGASPVPSEMIAPLEGHGTYYRLSLCGQPSNPLRHQLPAFWRGSKSYLANPHHAGASCPRQEPGLTLTPVKRGTGLVVQRRVNLIRSQSNQPDMN